MTFPPPREALPVRERNPDGFTAGLHTAAPPAGGFFPPFLDFQGYWNGVAGEIRTLNPRVRRPLRRRADAATQVILPMILTTLRRNNQEKAGTFQGFCKIDETGFIFLWTIDKHLFPEKAVHRQLFNIFVSLGWKNRFHMIQ